MIHRFAFHSSVRLALAATISIGTTAFVSNRAYAQTPTSDVYAFTQLSFPSFLSSNSSVNVNGISNGVIVGNEYSGSNSFNRTPVRWNTDGTITNLGSQLASSGINLGSNPVIMAEAISNGVTVGGGYGNPAQLMHALRWNADGTVTDLHTLAGLNDDPQKKDYSYAFATSNGVTVGYASIDRESAMRWNADGTITDLGLLASAAYGLPIESRGLSISDGITVGYAVVHGNTQMALRWNANGTVVNLSQQLKANGYGSDISAAANGTSGGVTVGWAKGQSTSNSSNAVRWNTDGSVTNLHNQIAANGIDLGSNSYSIARAIANGLTVGSGASSAGGHALLWKADGSVVDLQRFAPSNALVSGAEEIDESTGIILGGASINGNYAPGFWTPLNAGSDGANDLTIQNGYLTTISRNFSQSAGQTVVNGGLVFDDGNSGNGVESFTLAGGTLSGAGSITGNLTQTGGVIAPGNSPGTLTINGDYLMSAGTYSIDIASLSSFDVLNVTGMATFTGGSFQINALSGYTPTIGDFFSVITTGNGIFGTDAVTTPEGWKFSQNGNMGQLAYIGPVVVPEAGTVLLVLPALGLLGIAMLRRKNSRA